MSSQTSLTIKDPSDQPGLEAWKRNVLLIGGLVGASVGLLSAYLLVKNSEQRGELPTLGAREGVKIAILAFGLVRSVANLWED